MSVSLVRLFPLPNVVLFPGAVLPLHIFEERYKSMTADALEDDKLIAIALLKSGWEKDYYQRPAIDPVVCVGKIMASEKLPDGKYNFLLHGQFRARITSEIKSDNSYRTAEAIQLHETPALEIDLEAERHRLYHIFKRSPWSRTSIGQQFQRVMTTDLSTPQIADLVAFNFLEDASLKQQLLAQTDVAQRVKQTIDALSNIRPTPTEPTPVHSDPSWN